MELNGSSSNTHQNHSSEGSQDASKEMSTGKEVFVNHAEIAWHQKRKEWVGDQSKKLQRQPRESIMRYMHASRFNYSDGMAKRKNKGKKKKKLLG